MIWTLVDGKKVVNLHKYQQMVLLSDAKYTFMIAGTGGGKSSFLPVLLADRMVKRENNIIIVSEPTYYMLEHIAIPNVIDFLKGTFLEGSFSEKDMSYENRKGIILFKSSEKPDFLEGIHADWVFADEVGQYKRRAWVVLSNRVTLKNGQFFGLTTPYNEGWMYREAYHQWKMGNPDYNVIQFASIENPAFPKEEFEKKKHELDDNEFSMRYLGEFAKARGLVFNITDDALVDSFEISPRVWCAMDFGFGHPTAIVYFTEVEKNGTKYIYIFDEYKSAGEDYEVHTLNNLDRFKQYNIFRVYYDPSNPQGAMEMKKWFQRYGVNVKFIGADNRIIEGVREVNSLLKQKKLLISRLNCPELLSESEGYIYKGDLPIKEDDDLMDALRYGIMGWKSFSKPVEEIRLRKRTEAEKHIDDLHKPAKKGWLYYP